MGSDAAQAARRHGALSASSTEHGGKMVDADVLMIAHRRTAYLAQSLPRLLDSLPDGARLWLWQNGDHPGVSQIIEEHRSHPRFFKYRRASRNQGLATPTNWLWESATGRLLGKVDDDCLVSSGWVEAFARAHMQSNLGIIASWHFAPDDLMASTVEERSVRLNDSQQLLLNCWVGGSGYLMKRACQVEHGLVSETRTFTDFCLDASTSGWMIGWHYPLILQDHMDDPRSPNTQIRSDDDLQSESAPLGARRLHEPTVRAWEDHLKAGARYVQTASLRPRDHRGWRRRGRRALDAIVQRSAS